MCTIYRFRSAIGRISHSIFFWLAISATRRSIEPRARIPVKVTCKPQGGVRRDTTARSRTTSQISGAGTCSALARAFALKPTGLVPS